MTLRPYAMTTAVLVALINFMLLPRESYAVPDCLELEHDISTKKSEIESSKFWILEYENGRTRLAEERGRLEQALLVGNCREAPKPACDRIRERMVKINNMYMSFGRNKDDFVITARRKEAEIAVLNERLRVCKAAEAEEIEALKRQLGIDKQLGTNLFRPDTSALPPATTITPLPPVNLSTPPATTTTALPPVSLTPHAAGLDVIASPAALEGLPPVTLEPPSSDATVTPKAQTSKSRSRTRDSAAPPTDEFIAIAISVLGGVVSVNRRPRAARMPHTQSARTPATSAAPMPGHKKK